MIDISEYTRNELNTLAEKTATVEDFIDELYSKTYAEERKRKIRIIREDHQYDGSNPPTDEEFKQKEIEHYLNN